jgi:hypothetical protein
VSKSKTIMVKLTPYEVQALRLLTLRSVRWGESMFGNVIAHIYSKLYNVAPSPLPEQLRNLYPHEFPIWKRVKGES